MSTKGNSVVKLDEADLAMLARQAAMSTTPDALQSTAKEEPQALTKKSSDPSLVKPKRRGPPQRLNTFHPGTCNVRSPNRIGSIAQDSELSPMLSDLPEDSESSGSSYDED